MKQTCFLIVIYFYLYQKVHILHMCLYLYVILLKPPLQACKSRVLSITNYLLSIGYLKKMAVKFIYFFVLLFAIAKEAYKELPWIEYQFYIGELVVICLRNQLIIFDFFLHFIKHFSLFPSPFNGRFIRNDKRNFVLKINLVPADHCISLLRTAAISFKGSY